MLPGLQAAPLTKSASGVVSTASAGLRSRIINGGFGVNQRNVAGTVVLAAGAYGHDRWKAGVAGCTYTYSTVAGVTALNITAGSLVQVIEGANVEGGTYTASSTGTAQGRVLGGIYASAPFQITGVTAGINLGVEFGIGTIASVQLEPGTVGTPFERRPIGLETLLCQRYFEVDTTQLGGAYPTGGAGASTVAQIVFKANKRIVPTMVQLPSSSSVNVSANSFLTVTPDGSGLSATIGAASGNYSLFLNWSASSEL